MCSDFVCFCGLLCTGNRNKKSSSLNGRALYPPPPPLNGLNGPAIKRRIFFAASLKMVFFKGKKLIKLFSKWRPLFYFPDSLLQTFFLKPFYTDYIFCRVQTKWGWRKKVWKNKETRELTLLTLHDQFPLQRSGNWFFFRFFFLS